MEHNVACEEGLDWVRHALLLLIAIIAGAVLISRNIRHMDLLLRLQSDARLLLYDRAASFSSTA